MFEWMVRPARRARSYSFHVNALSVLLGSPRACAGLVLRGRRIFSINAIAFGRRQSRGAPGGSVGAVPPVSRELECVRRGAGPDIDAAFRPSAGIKNHDVVRELAPAARDKIRGAVFLHDAQGPAVGPLDGVETHDCAVDAG